MGRFFNSLESIEGHFILSQATKNSKKQALQATKHYSAFTETGATQIMKTNQRPELKQWIPTFSHPANQMSGTKQ